jgi:hypothetical protein
MMAHNQGTGKVICIHGPPLSGKTYLINQILNEFDDFYTINYEMFFNPNIPTIMNYNKFYDYAYDSMHKSNLILESAYNRITSPHYNQNIPVPHFSVLCWPNVSIHQDRVDAFRILAGNSLTHRRIGSLNIRHSRQAYTAQWHAYGAIKTNIIFTGENVNEVKEGIKAYVFS